MKHQYNSISVLRALRCNAWRNQRHHRTLAGPLRRFLNPCSRGVTSRHFTSRIGDDTHRARTQTHAYRSLDSPALYNPRFSRAVPEQQRLRATRAATAAAQPMSSFAQSARAFINHPAGPKTIFFWAPTMKWGITAANVKDFSRPPELLSVPQQSAVTLTGLIWCKYALDITPVNYNLMAVNAVMAVTGSYQLYRKFSHDAAVKAAASAGE